MSIGPPILEIQHFQNLTLKINGQGHGWGHSSKSQCWSSILSTHIPFVPCQLALPFLRYSIFKVWPWKSRVKVMGEVTVQSHNVGLASYRLTSLSFHVNRVSHSWDTAFSKFDLENQGSRSWVRSQLTFTMWVSYWLIPFVPCQSALPFLDSWYSIFKIWPWKIKGQGQMTLMLHNYRLRQFHRTWNGINPSNGFKDMGSAKSGPSAAWFDKFLAHGQTHMGQMGK